MRAAHGALFVLVMLLLGFGSASIKTSNIKPNSYTLGHACLHTYECYMGDRNSECDTGNTDTCICTASYVEEFTECKVKVDGSTACASTDDCPSNAICAGQCSCNSNYTESSFLCTAVVGMGCTLDSQCTDGMANTVCSSSQCACASGYTGPACTAVVDMVCTLTSQCTDVLANTACESSQCACVSGYSGASCTAIVGMACTLASHCTDLLANTVCSSSQCVCVSGFTGTTCTDVVVGMVCANDADCQNVLSTTVCTSLQCTCAAGFSGSACSSAHSVKLSKTTTIPIATILLTVIYKCLS